MTTCTSLHNANRARTRHYVGGEVSPFAALIIEARDGSDVTIFGPASAMDAFDRAAEIIQEALRVVAVKEAAE